MSIKCSGKNAGSSPCKITVPLKGDYCRFHINQKVKRDPCLCLLDNGSSCPYPAVKNGFCEYHPEPVFCQGRTLLGGTCLKAIPAGRYCWNCSRQKDVIMDSVKESADLFREYLIKDGAPIIPTKKATTVFMANTVTIPTTLKKMEYAKPDNCSICLEPMIDKYRALSCGHYHHDNCLSQVSKMECTICRAPISKSHVPKWVTLRIKENIEAAKKERQEQNMAATQQFIRDIVQGELLDMNSSEEEDLDAHIEDGAEMGIGLTIDMNGQPRLALIVLGGSPN